VRQTVSVRHHERGRGGKALSTRSGSHDLGGGPSAKSRARGMQAERLLPTLANLLLQSQNTGETTMVAANVSVAAAAERAVQLGAAMALATEPAAKAELDGTARIASILQVRKVGSTLGNALLRVNDERHLVAQARGVERIAFAGLGVKDAALQILVVNPALEMTALRKATDCMAPRDGIHGLGLDMAQLVTHAMRQTDSAAHCQMTNVATEAQRLVHQTLDAVR
jgi:hypothetical protein